MRQPNMLFVRFVIVTLVGLLAMLTSPSRITAEDQPVLVGTSATGHVHPSICRTKDGTLIVVFKGANVLLCSRSTDSGQTWQLCAGLREGVGRQQEARRPHDSGENEQVQSQHGFSGVSRHGEGVRNLKRGWT